MSPGSQKQDSIVKPKEAGRGAERFTTLNPQELHHRPLSGSQFPAGVGGRSCRRTTARSRSRGLRKRKRCTTLTAQCSGGSSSDRGNDNNNKRTSTPRSQEGSSRSTGHYSRLPRTTGGEGSDQMLALPGPQTEDVGGFRAVL